MKHLKTMTKTPGMASNQFPTSLLIAFIQDILGAVLILFIAKETQGTPTA